MSGASTDLLLRAVRLEDAYALWLWANDLATRFAAFDRQPISWEEHTNWLGEQLASREKRMWLASTELHRPLGVVRFDTRDGWETARLSYVLAPEARGLGYGRHLVKEGLSLLRSEFPRTMIVADVRAENAPSLRIFRGLQWKETTGTNNHPRFVHGGEDDNP